MKKITWFFILILTGLSFNKILREVEQLGPTIPPPPWEEDLYADDNVQPDGTDVKTTTTTVQDQQVVIAQDNAALQNVNYWIQQYQAKLAEWTAQQAAINADIAAHQALIAQMNQADKTPPILTVTAPVDGDKVSGTIKIYGTAADKGGLAFIDIMVNGKDLGHADGLENWGFAFDTTIFPDGTDSIIVTAQDLSGNQTVSAPINVTASNGAQQAQPKGQ